MVLLETAPIAIKNDEGVTEIYTLEFIEIAETKNRLNEYLYKFTKKSGDVEYSLKLKLDLGEVSDILAKPKKHFEYLLNRYHHLLCYRIQIRFNEDFTDYRHGTEEIPEVIAMDYGESRVDGKFDKDIDRTDSFDFEPFKTGTSIYEIILWMKEYETIADVIPEIKRLILEYEAEHK